MNGNREPHDFEECLKEGKYWEKRLKERLQSVLIHNSVSNIDFADEPDKQRAGIDLEFTLKEVTSIDTKVRDHKYAEYEDIFIETMSDIHTDTVGWWCTTEADVIAYAWKNKAGSNLLNPGYLLIEPQGLRNWFDNICSEYDTKFVPNEGWTTQGTPIPIEEFPEESLVPFKAKLPTDRVTHQSELPPYDSETDKECPGCSTSIPPTEDVCQCGYIV